jgi:hypothetical protein
MFVVAGRQQGSTGEEPRQLLKSIHLLIQDLKPGLLGIPRGRDVGPKGPALLVQGLG